MNTKDQKDKIFQEFYKYIGLHHAENTAVKADELADKATDIDFPEELDNWAKEYFEDAIKKERQMNLKSKLSWISKRVAIFLIVLALGSFITVLNVDAYRVRISNLVTDIKEKYTSITIEREADEQPMKSATIGKSYYYPGYVPDGYKEIDIQNHGELLLIYFENDKGNIIEFLQSELDSDFQVDTENATTKEVYINGAIGMLVSKDDVNTLLWFSDTNNFYITGELEEKEVISMAESLEFINKANN